MFFFSGQNLFNTRLMSILIYPSTSFARQAKNFNFLLLFIMNFKSLISYLNKIDTFFNIYSVMKLINILIKYGSSVFLLLLFC